MQKEDKFAFAILALVLCVVLVGILYALKFVFAALFGWFDESGSSGVGFKEAFFYAIISSVTLVILFTLFAGDGILGELPTMVVSFFLFVVFFTVSIAWIF
jgi:hypothetical protein